MCFNKDQGMDYNIKEVQFVSNTTCPIDIELVKSRSASDPVMAMLRDFIYRGWPESRRECPIELLDYWNFRHDLVLEDGAILKGSKIVIPASLRKRVLNIVHTGHQGETKCILLARESVFWPRKTEEIKKMVRECGICNKYQAAQARLPILQPELPSFPWEKLGTDIFEIDGTKYLIIVDYFSRFPIIRKLNDITANTICNHFNSVFSEYGIPSTIVTDCGTQYTSEQFKNLCKEKGITVTYSSPYHHQTNGLSERAVNTCKSILKKASEESKCVDTAIWAYRITPLDCYLPSPYELLFGRKPRQILPTSRSSMMSHHPDNENHLEKNQHRQEKQAESYNNMASTDKRPLKNNEPVYVRNTLKGIWQDGTVLSRPNPTREPRTYMVDINGTLYQRTREHLKPRDHTPEPHTPPDATKAFDTLPNQVPCETAQEPLERSTPGTVTTRSGRVVRPPERFRE